ncbi:PucR family transcriptional regulator [Bifidobacterium gallicum]|uniref:Polyketide Synthase Expression n=1 Tax=Bifidobacterium gallicum DSM 20093 = LMG 11596 TaxID=561180 RepID=D1NVM6_9BIFI|nr:helix-turn-helix domain-containing protein [Bifidobacterium gallicum]EFA22877.1 hypothetical protein BIFGAL_03916 [Bifidobacterium gallicum DSM 20093 = LMG 11596]KFI59419.1 Polyketide Synthase Expression [Bifidobacterium gallicum DSM 20093 = LMG 11596]
MMDEQSDVLDLLAGHTDDTTIERLTFECLLNGVVDDRVNSLMHVLGWGSAFPCFAIGGTPREHPASTSRMLRQAVHDLGGAHALVGAAGTMVMVLATQESAVRPEVLCTNVLDAFADNQAVYISPVREGIVGASQTIRETYFSLQAAPAWLDAPRPVRDDDLLPERALLGDPMARDELYINVYRVVLGDSEDDASFNTVSTFLRHGGSLEATAKELNVHPNTVRYRLKRAAETSGWDATDPRDAFVLNTAIAIGRMRDH